MSKTYTNLIYHMVFATKDRQPLITADRRDRLYEYIGGTIRGLGGITLAINGVEDHVHLLAKLRPDKSLSDVLRDLKSNSSGWMHDVFPEAADFSWQRGYGAFTVSVSQIPRVQQYIAEQEKHHATNSFEDEFKGLLQKMRSTSIRGICGPELSLSANALMLSPSTTARSGGFAKPVLTHGPLC